MTSGLAIMAELPVAVQGAKLERGLRGFPVASLNPEA